MTLTREQQSLILTALDALAEFGGGPKSMGGADFTFEEIDGLAAALVLHPEPVELVGNLGELAAELNRRAAECNDGTEYGEGYADGYVRAAQLIETTLASKEALVF